MNFEIENKSIFASDNGKGIDKNKDTIVFLHGSGLSHIVWSLSEQFFSNNNFNVLSIDLPGHGNSEGPCLKTIEEIAEWLELVFDALDLQNLILVGHSQGCLEILEYSHRYKDRLKKIVFVGGSNKMPVHPDLIELAENGDSGAVKLMMKWGYEGSKKFIGGNPVERIIQSPKDISEILAVDLIACNNYKNGAGKEFAGNLKLPNSAENLSTYERFEIDKAFLVPFWVIGGFQFLHLLYACTISINLVCNKAGPIGTELKPGQEGLEVTESSSKNVPAIATTTGKQQTDFVNPAFGTLFGQQNAKDNVNIGAPDSDLTKSQKGKSDGAMKFCHQCGNKMESTLNQVEIKFVPTWNRAGIN